MRYISFVIPFVLVIAVCSVAPGAFGQQSSQTVNRQARAQSLQKRLDDARDNDYRYQLLTRDSLQDRYQRARDAAFRTQRDRLNQRLANESRAERIEALNAAALRADYATNARILEELRRDEELLWNYQNGNGLNQSTNESNYLKRREQFDGVSLNPTYTTTRNPGREYRREVYVPSPAPPAAATARVPERVAYTYRETFPNPFTARPSPNEEDRAEPVADVEETDVNQAVEASVFGRARRAFRESHYTTALELTDQAIAEDPISSSLQEFRSLVLFALRDYRRSAETLYSVLRNGSSWSYSTMIGHYPGEEMYRSQLRDLENYATQNPNRPEASFLLGYHYRLGGQTALAIQQLERYVQLVPNDPIAIDVLAKGGITVDTTRTEPPLAPPAGTVVTRTDVVVTPDVVEIPAVRGIWRARADNAGEYRLTLGNNNEFLWRYPIPTTAPLQGVYAADGDHIVFETDDGTVMVGTFTAAPEGYGLRVTGPGGAYLHFMK